jgi:molecular chaperone GrpE
MAEKAPDTTAPDDAAVRVIDRRWWARAVEADVDDETQARTSDKPVYVQELEQRLAAKDDELRTTISRYREASTEFDEMRARLRRDVAKEVERGRRLILADMLDIVDNLDRAVAAASEAAGAAGGAVLQGIEMVRNQLLSKLTAHGVTRLLSLHQRFDPAVHEAATVVPVTDRAQDGVILGVIHEGYVVGADVLRPAVVAVARFSDEGVAW